MPHTTNYHINVLIKHNTQTAIQHQAKDRQYDKYIKYIENEKPYSRIGSLAYPKEPLSTSPCLLGRFIGSNKHRIPTIISPMATHVKMTRAETRVKRKSSHQASSKNIQ